MLTDNGLEALRDQVSALAGGDQGLTDADLFAFALTNMYLSRNAVAKLLGRLYEVMKEIPGCMDAFERLTGFAAEPPATGGNVINFPKG